ncbi:MAG: hypothetical protein RL695_618 [Pseudomonadota bacterium]|jgi:hypothetical protein
MSAHKNIGASVRVRLLNRAKDNGADYGMMRFCSRAHCYLISGSINRIALRVT